MYPPRHELIIIILNKPIRIAFLFGALMLNIHSIINRIGIIKIIAGRKKTRNNKQINKWK
jgi:hypothetical protein